jgi:hypothetical protein
MANLRRTRDGAGDSGACSQAISWNEDKTLKEVVGRRPTIGCSMLVGSTTARSYAGQDYWLTTAVTEILEEITNDDTDYVRFKTGNSVYEWWEGVYPESGKTFESL